MSGPTPWNKVDLLNLFIIGSFRLHRSTKAAVCKAAQAFVGVIERHGRSHTDLRRILKPCLLSDYIEDLNSAAGLEDATVAVTAPSGQATVCGLDAGDEVGFDRSTFSLSPDGC